MNNVLLLGAGFSRNWGGWLAPEVFEYLLGCPEVDEELRSLLWKHKDQGGFEAALGELQDAMLRGEEPQTNLRLNNLQNAIRRTFVDMDQGFEQVPFEFQQRVGTVHKEYTVSRFLVRFHAIFTLNLDLLLERCYLDSDVALLSDGRWNASDIPGMRPIPCSDSHTSSSGFTRMRQPDEQPFIVRPRSQPYFKLHGSINWFDSASSQELIVLGTNKTTIIERYPVLQWYYKQLNEYLSRPDTRLMVIGYSFGDDHISNIIRDVAGCNNLRIFIIDPAGVDVLDNIRNAQSHPVDQLSSDLQPHVIGVSRRSLEDIFGGDAVEHQKIMRFFS